MNTVEDFREIVATLNLDPGVLDPVAAAEGGLNFRAVEAALTAKAIREALSSVCERLRGRRRFQFMSSRRKESGWWGFLVFIF